MRWKDLLNVDTLYDNINRAICGGFSPVGLLMTEAELAEFAAEYAPQLYGRYPDIATCLPTFMSRVLMGWVPLELNDYAGRSAVPIYKLVYLLKKHNPGDKTPDSFPTPVLILGNAPVRSIMTNDVSILTGFLYSG